MSTITEIIDWVKTDKPLFWQEAVGRIIQKNILSEKDFLELVELCKSEKGLAEYSENLINLEELKESIEESESVSNISIIKIFNTHNIAALQNNSDLIIEKNGLTVIYGDNGSGKSSYVSILKQVCSTRGDIPVINQNLFLDPTESQDQKAKIKYKIEDEVNSVTWENGNYDSEILKSVHIFDAKSASSYIEDEDEIAFTPSGLLIIEQLANACNEIEENLKEEVNRLKLKQFDYSFLINEEDNDIQTFLINLSAKSNIKKLKKIAVFTSKDKKLVKAIEQRIVELLTLDPTKKIDENNKIIDRFILLKTRYQQISAKLSITRIKEIKKDIIKKQELQNAIKALTEKTFSDLPLDKIGSESWKELWNSAKKFYQYSTDKEFPDTDKESVCPLCLQALNDATKKRFTNFEKFVKADIQTQLDTVNRKLSISKQKIENINLDFSEIQTTIIELNDINCRFKTQHNRDISKINQYITSITKLFNNPKKVNEFKEKEKNISLIETINKIVKKISKKNKEFSNKLVSKELVKEKETLLFLKSKKSLFENKKRIIDEINRQKSIEIFLLCLESCNTRNISLFCNALSDKYITETLKDNFKEELTKLGFSNIKIATATRGISGKQYHSLKLDSSYGSNIYLKEILSEGEHRCISLATFLSELSVSEHQSAIIFDDPVSSLDHKWRRKIAERIVQEANKRQVIVFTHDITFLLNLQEFSVNLNIQSLTREKTKTGVTSKNPPWDALSIKKRIGILENLLQELKKVEQEETEEVFKEQSKKFYGKLRETWERFIEEIVLNMVIERFSREIKTKRLKSVTDFSENDYKKIDENMKKCSIYMTGHDTAGELIEEMPSIDNVENDLNVLDEFIKEIKQRRR